MPNWNYNSVEIHAPLESVKEWLIPTLNDSFVFNMHKLFPEKIPADDPTGDRTWEHDWYVSNTGSKWSPEVHVCISDVAGVTMLGYDSAWSPNNGTLQRLHERTGWRIRNEYIEEGAQLCGCLTCEGGDCQDEEQEYMTSCEVCEERKPEEEFDEEADDLICNGCRRKAVASLAAHSPTCEVCRQRKLKSEFPLTDPRVCIDCYRSRNRA